MNADRGIRHVAVHARRFRVGVRIGGFHAQFPFGSLAATSNRIIVSAVLKRTTLHRRHVTAVFAKRTWIRSVVGFRTDDRSGDWVFVYTSTPDALLAVLGRLGWPIAN